MWSQQREVFPGLDSGPNDSEGHYSMPWKNVPLLTPHMLLKFITTIHVSVPSEFGEPETVSVRVINK